jgi:hypothetical protein
MSYTLQRSLLTTVNIKPSQSSLVVAWQRLSAADVRLPLSSPTIPDLSYKLVTFQNCNSQLTVCLQIVFLKSKVKVRLGVKPIEAHD